MSDAFSMMSPLTMSAAGAAPKPVWIVDDDKSIRWVFEKALGREGIAFRTFASGAEALAALEDGTPQVVISDIRMPGGSGLELLQRLKELQPQLPVIIMTAYSDLESAVTAFQGGAYEYLPKPFDVDHAVELIRRVSSGKTLVIVEHDMSVVFDLADVVTVLVYGQVIASGPPAEIRASRAVQDAYLGAPAEIA